METITGRTLKGLALCLAGKDRPRFAAIRARGTKDGRTELLATDGRILARVIVEGNGVNASIPAEVAKAIKGADDAILSDREIRCRGIVYALPAPDADGAFPDMTDIIPPEEPAPDAAPKIMLGSHYMETVGAFFTAVSSRGSAVRARFGPDTAPVRFDAVTPADGIVSATVVLMPMADR